MPILQIFRLVVKNEQLPSEKTKKSAVKILLKSPRTFETADGMQYNKRVCIFYDPNQNQ